MLRELLKKKEFLKIVNKFLKEKEIIDIIIFGSLVRGKEKPQDIDILVIYNEDFNKIIEINHKLKKFIQEIVGNVEVIGKKYSDIFKSEFIAREAILSDGFSLKEKKFISEGLGYRNFILFKYSLVKMNNSKRMRFYYSLYGRGNEKGFLNKNNIYKFSDGVILSPVESYDIVKKFFEIWKINFIDFPILIPERIIRYVLKK